MDYVQAYKWFSISMAYGDSAGRLRIETIMKYLSDDQLAKSRKEVFNWFKLSAQRGLVQSQVILAVFYESGKGVDEDFVQAHKWYTIAEANGNKLGAEGRKVIEKRMIHQDISEARQLAREWMKEHPKK